MVQEYNTKYRGLISANRRKERLADKIDTNGGFSATGDDIEVVVPDSYKPSVKPDDQIRARLLRNISTATAKRLRK